MPNALSFVQGLFKKEAEAEEKRISESRLDLMKQLVENVFSKTQEDMDYFEIHVSGRYWDYETGSYSRAEYTFGGDSETFDISEEKTGFKVWKTEEGKMLFSGIFTNAFLDNDGQREILTHQAHIDFESKLLDGDLPYPVLQIAHTNYGKEVRKGVNGIGQVLWAAYDQETRMFNVVGEIFKEYEWAGEALAKSDGVKGMSHGFRVKSRENNEILEYETEEVSVLPLGKAANLLTGFQTNKGNAMAINESQIELLQQVLGDESAVERMIADMEAEGKQLSGLAEDLEIPTKSAEEEAEEEVTETEEEAEEEAQESDEEGKETSEEVSEEEVTEGEIDPMADPVSAILAAVEMMAGKIEGIAQDVKANADHIENLQKDESEKIAAKVAATPLSSAASLLNSSPFVADATIDGRSAIAKSAPAENGEEPRTWFSQ